MKINKIFIIAVLCLIAVPSFAAKSGVGSMDGICELIQEFQEIFKLLRTLAFVGAGMLIAKYAWDAISTGKIADETDLTKAAKKVGVPMIVGFILLFGIGVLLQVLSSVTGVEMLGCEQLFTNW